MTTLDRTNIVDFLADVIHRRGGESYLGEAVTMREHMLQSAYQAEQAQADPRQVAGALLHDIGHFTSDFPEDALEQGMDNRHQEAGAAVLQRFFPDLTVNCVRHHVAAKRYLCTKRPGYLAELSDASVESLSLQGGPMNDRECAEFERLPDYQSILEVRLWDDGAKVPEAPTPDFDHFRPLLNELLTKP